MGAIEVGNRGTKLCGFGRLLSEVCGGVLQDSGTFDPVDTQGLTFYLVRQV